MVDPSGRTAPAIAAQLKEAVKISRARWAAWLQLSGGVWTILLQVNLGKSRQAALLDFTGDQKTAIWLAGTFSSGRLRSRQTGLSASALGCQRLYVFPNAPKQCALAVGADALAKPGENIFRILACNPPSWNETHTEKVLLQEDVLEPDIKALDQRNLIQPEFGHPGLPHLPYQGSLEVSYNPQAAFKNVLEHLVGSTACDAAYLMVRSGDIFRVEAVWNYPEERRGQGFSTADNEILADITAKRRGLALEDTGLFLRKGEGAQFDPGETDAPGMSQKLCSWMGIPIVIGQRVIGLVILVSGRPAAFGPEDLQRASAQVERLAYAVENAIVFSETARYLQQLALLNEMASAASLGVDTHEVARRVMERLRRTFRTDRAGVFLLSADRKTLLEYGSELEGIQPRAIPVEKSLVGHVVKTGLPLRAGVRSILAVPLKYHGAVIGALALENNESNAFTLQDEQLLVGIASHMAGLFENMRLNEETRERAQKLQDSVRQLQAVRETALEIGSAQGNLDLDTLLQRVVRRACELVDARGAELGLLDEEQGVVTILVSEKPWQQAQTVPLGQAVQIPLMADVAGRVAAFGEPLVVNDYNTWGGRLSPDYEAPFKTVAGVPLKFQGQVIGALTVSDDRPGKVFRPEDIQMLELLAPLVTVWIRNARLYQELQERIEAQQVAENHLVRSARLAAVGEMAAGVAHELNNPLTTVAGFVELVLEELPQDSPHRPDLELVLREAQRARGVVRRLLDFSRPAENQHVRTDLNELVGDILTLVHHLVRTGGVEMHIELWEDLPWISVDPAQIKQVLLNLVHNAIQAMPRGGTLAVKTAPVKRQDRDWLSISVSDTGVGISTENMERIFEPFFTTRPAGQGTGLGLSVSYGIITEHGGYIEADSHLGQGSCFYIFLPVDGFISEQEVG